MKIAGRKPTGLKEELLVIPREEGDFAFKFRAVAEDYPEAKPTAPHKIIKGATIQDSNDPVYQTRLSEWATRKAHWHFLTSISATPDLQWENVSLEDAGTWQNWETELKESGFSEAERSAIWQAYIRANFLSEEMLEEARKRFLASPAETPASSSSPPAEQPST